MKLGPKRIVRLSNTWEPSQGSFSSSTRFFDKGKSRWKVSYFESCREMFQAVFRQATENLVYYHPDNERQRIAEFIWKLEDTLGIKHHTRIGPTQRPNYTWFHICSFWLQQPMRRSFFTAALRAARYYNGNNFKTALYSVRYFTETKPATERFLKGFSWYTGRVTGWQNAFQNRKEEQLEKLLVVPPPPPQVK